jgi:hypothetical protein
MEGLPQKVTRISAGMVSRSSVVNRSGSVWQRAGADGLKCRSLPMLPFLRNFYRTADVFSLETKRAAHRRPSCSTLRTSFTMSSKPEMCAGTPAIVTVARVHLGSITVSGGELLRTAVTIDVNGMKLLSPSTPRATTRGRVLVRRTEGDRNAIATRTDTVTGGRQKTACCQVATPPLPPLLCPWETCDSELDPLACSEDTSTSDVDGDSLLARKPPIPSGDRGYWTREGAVAIYWLLTRQPSRGQLFGTGRLIYLVAHRWWTLRNLNQYCGDFAIDNNPLSNLPTLPPETETEHPIDVC